MTTTRTERCVTCGKPVLADSGLRDDYEGEEKVFCSPTCQARFECEPARYLGDSTCLDCPPGYT
jgi:YHS domain-containing protein